MILVTSPPACGKTYISKQLARNLKHVVYLDKDTLIPLSNRVFAAAHEPVNRSSPFFEENIRDYEYETIVDIGVEALEYDDIVLINAPFTKEVHNEETLERFRTKLRTKGKVLPPALPYRISCGMLSTETGAKSPAERTYRCSAGS